MRFVQHLKCFVPTTKQPSSSNTLHSIRIHAKFARTQLSHAHKTYSSVWAK